MMSRVRRVDAAEFSPPSSHVAPKDVVAAIDERPFVWWRSQIVLMVMVFALLLAGAVLWTLLIPPSAQPAPGSQISVENRVAPDDAADGGLQPTQEGELLPWQAQQNAAARTQAQAVLADLIRLKTSLETLAVEEWAKTEFDAALNYAENGDENYALQDYPLALSYYERALEVLNDVQGGIPKVVKRYLAAANESILNRKLDLARENIQSALKLEPNSIPTLTLLARLEILPDAFALFDSAEVARQRYQQDKQLSLLESAVQDYQAAIDLDPLLSDAQIALTQTQQRLQRHQFDQAMSKALSALIGGQYAQAQTFFNNALQFEPSEKAVALIGSDETQEPGADSDLEQEKRENQEYALAKSGLEQALALNKGNSITSLFAQARVHETKESWQQALATYQAILSRDPSQVRARSALVQARVRANLDQQLQSFLADPLRATQKSVRVDIQNTLSQAKGISKQGAVLSQQIQQLETLLKGTNRSVTVEISSDQATTVFLLKRGARPIEYAPFATKTISLLPGRYALSGQRVGYQDVRKDLIIEPNFEASLRVDVRSDRALAPSTTSP